jgi:branched-chain amino acid aminotransferase
MRAYAGKPAFVREHLARLRRGCDVLRIPLPEDLAGRVAATLAANGAPDCAVRVTLTRGPGGRGASPRGAGPPTVLVALSPIPYPDELYERGLRAVVSRLPRTVPPDPALKSTNYLGNVLARLEADDAGADEALFADEAGRLLEATQANLLVVRGGELVTPPLGAILPGVTRAKLLALAPQAGLSPVERPLTREDAWAADEAMLCASVLEVAPLAQLDGRPIRRGAVAQKLRALYRLQAKSDG